MFRDRSARGIKARRIPRARRARQGSVNFQIWMLIYNAIAAIQASDGKFYRYPMTIRFIQ
jgi:hypothetical protein